MPQSIPDAQAHHGETSMDHGQSGESAPAEAVAAEFPSPEEVPESRRNALAAELCSGILALAALLAAAALITMIVLPLAREFQAGAARSIAGSWLPSIEVMVAPGPSGPGGFLR